MDAKARLWMFGSSPSESGGTGKGMLEIIDVANRSILVSQEMASSFDLIDGGPLAYTRHTDDGGRVS